MDRASIAEGRLYWGGDVAQLVRASDRHAADAGSIPQCGKGFFPPIVNFQCRLSYMCPYTPVCNRIQGNNICALVKDPVVHVRIRWIVDSLDEPASELLVPNLEMSG